MKLIVPFDDVESIQHWGLLMKGSDGLRMDGHVRWHWSDTLHLDNTSMTKVVQPLDDNPMAKQFETSMLQGLSATTQGLDDSMACGRSNGATIRPEVFAATWVSNDRMACRQSAQGTTTSGFRIGSRIWGYNGRRYNDELSEKATIWIRR